MKERLNEAESINFHSLLIILRHLLVMLLQGNRLYLVQFL